MKTNKNKFLIIIFMVIVLGIIIKPSESKAVLQGNGGTAASYNIENWLLKIRQMEASGGTFGLNASINGTTLLDSGESNGLDCHMELNTEYGAVAILSASPYGNPAKVNDGGTTTGNETGVVMKLNSEVVSAGTISDCKRYVNADIRYKNPYTNSYVAKKGDAVLETAGWHGSGASDWLFGRYYSSEVNTSVLLRSYEGSIFSYYGISSYGGAGWFGSYYPYAYHSRAVVVIGKGL